MNIHRLGRNLGKNRVQRDFFAATFFSFVVILTAIALVSTGCTSRLEKPKGSKNTTAPQKSVEAQPGETLLDETDADAGSTDQVVDLNKVCDTVTDGNPAIRIGDESDPRSFEVTECKLHSLRILLLSMQGQWTEINATPEQQPISSRRSACFPTSKWENLYNGSDFKEFQIEPIQPDLVKSTKSYFEFGGNKNWGQISTLAGSALYPGLLTPIDAEHDFVSASVYFDEASSKFSIRTSNAYRPWRNDFAKTILIKDFVTEGLRTYANDDCKESDTDADPFSGTKFPISHMRPEGAKGEYKGQPPRFVIDINNIIVYRNEDSSNYMVEGAFHMIDEVNSVEGSIKNSHIRHYVVKVDTGVSDPSTLRRATKLSQSAKMELFLDHSYLSPNLADYANTDTPVKYSRIIPMDNGVGYKRYFERSNEKRLPDYYVAYTIMAKSLKIKAEAIAMSTPISTLGDSSSSSQEKLSAAVGAINKEYGTTINISTLDENTTVGHVWTKVIEELTAE